MDRQLQEAIAKIVAHFEAQNRELGKAFAEIADRQIRAMWR